MSLKLRLGIGAALLGIGTLATALILWLGLQAVSERLDAALAAEGRMARYATLSQQTATFLVVATESIQTGLSRAERADRIDPVVRQMRETFQRLHADVGDAVAGAEAMGLDVQSRYATQSLGLARMEALLTSALRGLDGDSREPAQLRAYVDTFSASFDPLLSQAVNTEVLFRTQTLNGIETLRQTLTRAAMGIVLVTIAAVALFYLALVRPQFRRLDLLRQAARQVASADFSVALPSSGRDEITQLFEETNRMAEALMERQRQVEAEASRLTETITEQTEELRAANDTLAEIDENRRRFFADISHELRTPLTVILMEAQIGVKETGNPAFATIETRAARLNRKIDDLLRVARSDTGQLSLDIQKADLAEVLVAVQHEIQAEADNAGLSLQVDGPQALMIECDANWIRQVLASLARNALRHARSGGKLRIHAGIKDGEAELRVIDNGPGIAASEQARVFERFRQGGAGNAQGFGVGLALARWVIQEHGGRIEIESPLPPQLALGDAPGTAILIRLPGLE